jgi:membrane-associated protease RseP (regulator of RpoE activity)
MNNPWLKRGILAVALAGAASTAAQAAAIPQRVDVLVEHVSPEQPSVGWLGFRSTVHVLFDESGSRLTGSSLQVSEVFSDGPADRSGLRPGDVLVGFNGAALGVDRFQSVAQRLRPGDPVALTVLREGRRIELTLTAEPRPGIEVMVPLQLQRALDASRTTFVARLDSVRAGMTAQADRPGLELRRIRADSLQTVRVVSEGGTRRFEIRTPDGVFEWIGPGAPEPSSAPQAFSAWVYHAAPEQTRREVVITSFGDRGVERAPRLPSVLAPPAPVGRAAHGATPPTASSAVRPLAPYLAGLNRVAGAEFTTLSGELATYFHVDRGLLVTDVADGTPAFDTGLVPGDVLIEAGGKPVSSIDGLRAALSASEGPVILGLVRRGLRVDVRLAN